MKNSIYKRIILCLLFFLVSGTVFFIFSCSDGSAQKEHNLEIETTEAEWDPLDIDEYRAAVLQARQRGTAMLTLYRDHNAREEVIQFFEGVLHSRELAEYILRYSDEYDISPSLTVALAWEESRFMPRAVNRNVSSIDRGLFQLNNRSFPKLKEEEFFDPEISARNGIAHLRWCLDLAGSEVSGLAMYNAGTTRVRSDGTPKRTLDYVSRILSFREGLETVFDRELMIRWMIVDGTVVRVSPRFDSANAELADARPRRKD